MAVSDNTEAAKCLGDFFISIERAAEQHSNAMAPIVIKILESLDK